MSRHQEPGFTLIEVVLALAILGAGLFGILAASSRCLAVVSVTRDYEIAHRVMAQGDLDYPLTPTVAIEDVEIDERYDDGFRYTREVEEIEDEDSLFIVRTAVIAPGGRRQTRMEVVRYLYTTNYPDFERDQR